MKTAVHLRGWGRLRRDATRALDLELELAKPAAGSAGRMVQRLRTEPAWNSVMRSWPGISPMSSAKPRSTEGQRRSVLAANPNLSR